ncbi:hypothetical protein HaLaN_03074, partial [Haematococcus lacustris]
MACDLPAHVLEACSHCSESDMQARRGPAGPGGAATGAVDPGGGCHLHCNLPCFLYQAPQQLGSKAGGPAGRLPSSFRLPLVCGPARVSPLPGSPAAAAGRQPALHDPCGGALPAGGGGGEAAARLHPATCSSPK